MSKMQVELAAADLNHQGGVFCPSPKADMKQTVPATDDLLMAGRRRSRW